MTDRTTIKKAVEKPVIGHLFQWYLSFLNWQKRRSMQDKATMDMIYKPEDLNPEYYAKVKASGDRKFEHQIGRLTNFKQIVAECSTMNGDFFEFGSWRGFSLLWIAYFMERNALFNRKLIGMDSFAGIPYAEGQFFRYQYQDTSLARTQNNVLNNKALYRETRRNILIAKFYCREKEAITRYLREHNIRKLCFIHLDLDVSLSTKETMDMLLEGDFIADKAFLLFDDWGTETKIPEVMNTIFGDMRSAWDIREHSSTMITKNFLLERKR